MKACRIASLADIELIESRPYRDFMAHDSIDAALEDTAARFPSRRALTFVESADDPSRTTSWTYREFMADVRRAAHLFWSLAGPDEPRVAMLLPSIPQAYFSVWGAESVGVACPINYLLDSEHIAELIRASRATILVALGPNRDLDIWSRVPGLRERCPDLRHVLAVGGGPIGEDVVDFDAAVSSQPGGDVPAKRVKNADALAALFHTGGTTGAPKLAQHSHGNQLHSAWSAAQMYAMTEHDVIVNGFPMFHVAGSIVYGLSTLLSGAEIVLPTLLGMRNARLVARYWEVVERHRITLLAAVPTVMSTLLSVDPQGSSLTSVRALLTGGSPLPPELAVAFETRFAIPVRNILGMTECAGIVSVEPVLDDRVPGSCGLRLPFTRIEAVSADGPDTGSVCATGSPGILRLRGPNVGAGYTDARRNAGTLSDDGWLSTGDIGHVDACGRVFVTGRAKDVIIRSGHNIDPGVIEEALMRHPQVHFAAAVGEPDEYAGEIVVAFVVLKPDASVTADELLAFAKPLIPERPAHPRRIDFLSHLPLTAVGKVYKPGLRLRAIERVVVERLTQRGLSDRITVEGRDSASGLAIALTPSPGETVAALDTSVRDIMSPFAITWSWAV